MKSFSILLLFSIIFSVSYTDAQSILSQDVSAIALSPDETKLVVGYSDGHFQVRGFNKSRGSTWILFEKPPTNTQITEISWSLSNGKVAIGYYGDVIEIWDMTTFEKLLSIPIGDSRIDYITWSNDENFIFVQAESNGLATFIKFDANNGSLITSLNEELFFESPFLRNRLQAINLAFNETNNRLSSLTRDGTVRVWDTTTWELIAETNLNTEIINNASFSHTGEFLVYVEIDGDTEIKYLNLDHLVTRQSVSKIRWSHDGTKLAIGYYNGNFKILNVADMSVLFEQKDDISYIMSFAWNHTDTQLAVGRGGNVEIWDMVTFQKLLSNSVGSRVSYALTWRNDNNLIVSGDGELPGHIFDTTTGEYIGHIVVFSEVQIINNGSFGVGNLNFSTIFINLSDMTTISEIRYIHQQPTSISISPDEDIMSIGFLGGTIRIIDLQSVETVTMLQGWDVITEGLNFILRSTFNETGSQLYTLTLSGTLRIWDTTTWNMLASVELGSISNAADFSPDGITLAYANQGNPHVRFININNLINPNDGE